MPRTKPKPKRRRVENDHLETLRKRVAKAPEEPGIYRWLNADGTVLYVGKAKNLRNRLRSYVAKGKSAMGPWKESFLKQIADFEVTVTNSELEALIFETNLIKELRPKYNVLMKDDKNYIYARITVQDPYPRVESVRRIDPNDKAKYFGPMQSGGELWATLAMLRSIFPFRTCKMEIVPVMGEDSEVSEDPEEISSSGSSASSGSSFKIPIEVVCRHKDRPTPCLDHHIGKCSAPCVGLKTPEEYYRESIEGVIRFLKGDYDSVRNVLKVRMQQAALEKKFELAAQFRNHLTSIEQLQEKQLITDTSGEDSDIIAVAVLSSRAHVCVMQRRNGRLIGDQVFTLAGQADDAADVLSQFLPQYYGDGIDIPDMLIVSEKLPERKVVEQWLTELKGGTHLRQGYGGHGKVKVILPERGKKSRLLQLAEKNVQEKARQHEVKWEAEKANTENAMQQLTDFLKLPDAPERIEGYDISHLGGTETVGSMSVILRGKAANDHYRSFTIRTLKEGDVDDYKALTEVLKRRIRRLVEDLPAEEERWNEKGVIFGKAKKAEQKTIEEIHAAHPGDIGSDDIDYRQYLVARHEDKIVGSARLFEYPGTIKIVRSVWVAEEWRGNKLGQFIVRKILRSVKKGKVYIHSKESLQEYYAEVGFRVIANPPKVLEHKVANVAVAHPGVDPGLIMMYEARQNKIDPSLSARPDLIMVDGGKGQLSAAVSVLEEFGLTVPVIGLAKREEEVFVPGRSEPIIFPSDSPAKFLLMRLRDEAHRFANRHRESRGKKSSIMSALDQIPGIGDKTRNDLLKKFGSVSGIRSASDQQLLEIVSAAQLNQLRKML